MPFCDVYIGEADELLPLATGGVPTPSGPPKGLSRHFPPGGGGGGRDAFFVLLGKIHDGTLRGVHTDWGSSAALVTRGEIEAFTEEAYGPPGAYEARCRGTVLAHLVPWMQEVRAFVAALPPDRYFSLVAIEL